MGMPMGARPGPGRARGAGRGPLARGSWSRSGGETPAQKYWVWPRAERPRCSKEVGV